MAAITRTSTVDGSFGAERFDIALLQDAQQLRLHADAHGSDLVEEDRSAVGQQKLAPFRAGRARERPFRVAEQLRFDQRLRDGRAVDGDKRHVAPRAGAMDGARHQLFAGPGLAGNQHRAAGGGDRLDASNHVVDHPALADDAVLAMVFVNGRRWRHARTVWLREPHISLQVRQLASLGIFYLGEHATK